VRPRYTRHGWAEPPPLPPLPSVLGNVIQTPKLTEADKKLVDLGLYAGVVYVAEALRKAGAPQEWVELAKDVGDDSYARMIGLGIDRRVSVGVDGEAEWQSWLIELEMQSWAKAA
jgi:uncharacterized protein YjeT (DUF2065 family)